MVREERTNYSRGYVVEYVTSEEGSCVSWLLLPAENLWPEALRSVLYIMALAYLFLGIAIASDVFMCSIEVITSKKRTVVWWDEERKEKIERNVLIWNETVANLTLMALGSSAPEILLATLETVGEIDDRTPKDALGTFTIIGSAAFNLLVITAVCILSVPTGQVKYLKERAVFFVTSIWSIWAYVWMLIAVKYSSPGQIDAWEAWLTLGYLPLFVFMSYITDRGWLCSKSKVGLQITESGERENVRVVSHHQPSFSHSMPAELRVLEAERSRRLSINEERSPADFGPVKEWSYGAQGGTSLRLHGSVAGLGGYSAKQKLPRTQTAFAMKRHSSPEVLTDARGSLFSRRSSGAHKTDASHLFSRARFRHNALSALMGSSNFHRRQDRVPCMADMISKVKRIEDAISQGTSPDLVKQMLRRPSMAPFQCFHIPESSAIAGELLGKFTFATDRFAVLSTGGYLEVDVLLHRRIPSVAFLQASRTASQTFHGEFNTSRDRPKVLSPNLPSETDMDDNGISGMFTVDYETREGSAKSGRDFILQQGTLVFKEQECLKMLKVPIVGGKMRGTEVDFYIILKNPSEGVALGDPSIARVTVMDDKEPGEFLFEESTYYTSSRTGHVSVCVVREHGFDGEVTLNYCTVNGTAVGGPEIKQGVDYVHTQDQLVFEHGETTKTITVIINKDSEGYKNFIIAIRSASMGARVGIRSAVVVHLNKGRGSTDATLDELMERVVEVLEDEEEKNITWIGQFIQAMTVASEKDDEGIDIPLTWSHYLMHFLTFFWKIFCAFIPPTSIGGAWPAFFISLVFLGAMTAVVEQLGKLLGCVVGLKTSVAGITIIAMGTSLPDTFASRTAAIQDEHADAAIGNITGSNSVNVFLGLGLPWVLKTMHALYYGYTFKVKTDNLTQSVLVFCITAFICIGALLMHRKTSGGEIGGTVWVKYSLITLFLGLWFGYVVVISLHAYDYIRIPEF